MDKPSPPLPPKSLTRNNPARPRAPIERLLGPAMGPLCFDRFLFKTESLRADIFLRLAKQSLNAGVFTLIILQFFKMVYLWNLKVNAIATVLGFGLAFYGYKAIRESPWFTKVFIALMLSWGFASLVFLGRVCWEILNSTSFPTWTDLKGAIR